MSLRGGLREPEFQRLLGAFGEHFVAAASFTDGSGAWRGEATDFHLAGFILDRRRAAGS